MSKIKFCLISLAYWDCCWEFTTLTSFASVISLYLFCHVCLFSKKMLILNHPLLSTLGYIVSPVLEKQAYLLYLPENQHLLFKDYIFQALPPILLLSSDMFLSKQVYTRYFLFKVSVFTPDIFFSKAVFTSNIIFFAKSAFTSAD